jgi:hypothetical protein
LPVAKSQLSELHLVMGHYLRPNQVARLLEEFKRTEAYRSNQSFRITIDLLAQSGPLKQPEATEVIFGDE